MFNNVFDFLIACIIPAVLIGSFLVNHKSPSGGSSKRTNNSAGKTGSSGEDSPSEPPASQE